MKHLFTAAVLLAAALTASAQEEIKKTGINFGPLPAVGYSSDLGWHYGALTDIYQSVYELELSQIEPLKKEMLDLYHVAKNTFPDAPEKDRDYLDKFAFICLLSFDVYLKKRIIEHIADEMAGNKEDPRAKKKK